MKALIRDRRCEATAAYLYWLPIGGMALLAFCTTLIATPWGIGLAPDSLAYIGTARRISNGDGVTYLNDVGEFSPVNHYPPLYPSTIAALTLTGLDPLIAAKWMNAFLFACNVVLISLIAFAVTSSSGASLMAAFLTLTSFPMVQIHSMAWSEPLFILLGFSGFFFLAAYLRQSKRWMLCASAVSIALSCLARYAGIAWILAGTLGILFLSGQDRKKRIAHAILFSSLSSLPLLAWTWRNAAVAGSATNRALGFHPPGLQDLITALDSLCLWIFPPGIVAVPVWVRLFTLAVFFLLALRFSRTEVLQSRPVQLTCVFLFGYGLFVALARCYFDNAIKFDTRILAPAYVAAMILAVSLGAAWTRAEVLKSRSSSRFVFYGLVAVVFAMQMTTGLAWWRQSYADGIGFIGSAWRNSELIKFVDTVDSSRAIFTNVPDIIYMLRGRRTAMIPRKIDPKSRLPNKQYPVEIARMQQELNKTHGTVVYFHAEQRLWYLPSETELQRDADLRLVTAKKEGFIYRLN